METKSFSMKAAPGEGDAFTFEGYASTWTRQPDSYGDVVVKGAFADSLKDWETSGRSMPVLWSHEIYNPAAFVAKVVDATEDDHGLRVKGQFFEDDPDSMKVWRLLKEGLVSEMSFAFSVEDSAVIDVDGEKVRELRKMKLHEVSVVVFGANSDTSIESVKVGERFTAEEIVALKEIAASKSADEESEVARKSKLDEAALRVKEMQEKLDALRGEKGDSL